MLNSIEIAQRFKIFSHQPQATCLIPQTAYVVEVFPALIRIKDLQGVLVKEIAIDVKGPLKQFTLFQDLERGCVTLCSEHYRFHVLPNLEISFQKNPPLSPPASRERLSLGSHKKQEWESIKQRRDFKELFPLWFRLGSLLHLAPRKGDDRGVFTLLKQCKEICELHRPEEIIPAFEKLFLCGFGQMLVPRAWDNDYHGILLGPEVSEDSPLYLLTEGAALIRSLFLKAWENEIAILPNLPPEFDAGRMVGIACPPYGFVDLEWSKKRIRLLNFQATKEGEITFHFRSNVSHFRLRERGSTQERNLSCGDSLEIKSGSHYLLDRFQK